jgi:ferritin-like metal-binding protein YciE
MNTETTLQTLLVDELRDVYHAERQLVKALPQLAEAATSPDLRAALENHLDETETHVTRLEEAFGLLDEAVKAKACAGMRGIVEEGSELIKEMEPGMALDAAIIAGGQRAEHYEMAAYGTLVAWAKALGHDEVANLLETTLEEEKAADAKLTELAEAGINAGAANGDASEEAEPAPKPSKRARATAASRGDRDASDVRPAVRK